MDTYVSPGAAFSSGLAEYTAQRDAQARQAMLDKITQDREQRMVQEAQQKALMDQAALAHQQKVDAHSDWTFQQQQDEAARNDFTRKYVSNLMPGDVVDAGTVALGQKVGVPIATAPKQVADVSAGSDTAMLPGLDGQPSPAAMTGSALPEQKLTVPVYQGDAKYRQAQLLAQTKAQEAQPIIDALKNGADPVAVAQSAVANGWTGPQIKTLIDSVQPQDINEWIVGRDGKTLTKLTAPDGSAIRKGDHINMQPAPVNVNVGAGLYTAADFLPCSGRDWKIDDFINTGQYPPMGSGTSAGEARKAFDKIVGARLAELGMTGADIGRNRMRYRAETASASSLQKNFDLSEAKSEKAMADLKQFDGILDKIPDTGVRLGNKAVRALARQTDPNMAEYDSRREALANEYAGIVSNTNGGVLTDSAKDHMREIMNPDSTREQYRQAFVALQQEAQNRLKPYRGQLDQIYAPKFPNGGSSDGAKPTAEDLIKKYGGK